MSRLRARRASKRAATGRTSVVVITRASVEDELRQAASEAGLSYEEFLRRAANDDLEDDRLRDLWMMAGPALQ